MKNQHQGKKAVILCNGPSLNKVPFQILGDTYTFGLNKINLLFAKTEFRPSSIVAVNSLVIQQNAQFYNQTDIPLFLDRFGRGLVKFRKNVVFLHTKTHERFSNDCRMSVHQGGTVTYIAMQLAFHLGFRDLALAGCDHNFHVKGTPNSTETAKGPDLSHFDPNYFASGQPWQLPDLDSSERAYILARAAFGNAGGRIVNCTDGGNLSLFPRMSLDAWLQDRGCAVAGER